MCNRHRCGISGLHESRKENLLKRTARSIATSAIVCATLAPATASAGSHHAAALTVMSASVLAQADDQDSADPKRDVADLLEQAREAMKEGRLETADSYITRAEELDVRFGLLHFGDTPKKARRDLVTAIKREEKQPKRPSERVSPQQEMPQAKIPSPPQQPSVSMEDATNPLFDVKSSATRHIADARKALAEGNRVAAEHHYHQAVAQNAAFGPNEDSPEKLAADIRKAGGTINNVPAQSAAAAQFTQTEPPTEDPVHPLGLDAEQKGPLPLGIAGGQGSPFEEAGALMPPSDEEITLRMPAAGNSSQGGAKIESARGASDKLLLEAHRALSFGDVTRARQFGEKAEALGVGYEFHEDQPAKVLEAVQKFEILNDQQKRGLDPRTAKSQHAQLLLEQAEWLLKWNDLDTAERVVVNVSRMGVDFNTFGVSPQKLLERIKLARKQGPNPAGLTSAQEKPSPSGLVNPLATDTAEPSSALLAEKKKQALVLVAQARAALARGELPSAKQLAERASSLGVPDSYYAAGEDRPALVLLEIQKNSGPQQPASVAPGAVQGGVSLAGGAEAMPGQSPAGADMPLRLPTEPAVYSPAADTTHNVPAQAEMELRLPGSAGSEAAPQAELAVPLATEEMVEEVVTPGATGAQGSRDPLQMIEWGEQALASGNVALARTYFQEAQALQEQLDETTIERLELNLTRVNAPPGAATPAMKPGDLLPDAAAQQRLVYNQTIIELSRRTTEAQELFETDPDAGFAILEETRVMIEEAGLDSNMREVLQRRLAQTVEEAKLFVEQRQPMIDLKKRNKSIEEQIAREKLVKQETNQKLADLVDEYNTLMREERFAEAELIARRAEELAPDEPVVIQLKETSRLARNLANQIAIRDAKAIGFTETMGAVDEASIPSAADYSFGSPDDWIDLTNRRKSLGAGDGLHRSPREIEIEQRLRTPVSLNFAAAPLSTVIKTLGQMADVNIFLDEIGLADAGLTTDDPVTIDLSQDVQLKSALNLILAPRGLSYVIRDEVLRITSEDLSDEHVYVDTYNVADLVIPIPNFVPNGEMGMGGALRDAYGNVGYGVRPGMGSTQPLAVAASQSGGTSNATLDPSLMAQFSGGGAGGGGAAMGGGQSMGFGGPGGMGGGSQADFDELIELIVSTVAPTSWDEVGGPGSIREFQTNLSLVVSQTQEVHEQIVDLLEQLRRLQDLQVTIEVRFITLNDNFFERIGVDFDFDLDDNIDRPFQVFGKPTEGNGDASEVGTDRDIRDRDHGPSITVGQSAPGVFSTDLDIPFRQDSFTLATPQFGGFNPAAGASLGFAILSDLEAFFFINAAQGDQRSNVLQAPKVTLFNGQQASVADVSQSPFVISVIPVVGDFAAAQQPVIVVLSEGTFLTVQAVVSSDRRFVRLTVVPFFSEIRDVDTFTFTGSTTTTEDSSSEGPDDDTTARAEGATTVTEGTTVQLPTFAFVSVTTTVSVPDGGTVLLGGIKRLSEGRNEFGVPFLSKIPYVSRLFKNVGIGRETQSLMMMVTPRIIIQEEEEALILNNP